MRAAPFHVIAVALTVSACILDREGQGNYAFGGAQPVGGDAQGGEGPGGEGGGGDPTGGGPGVGGAGGEVVAHCGDGVVDADESCDDGNAIGVDGCADCQITPGFTCVEQPSKCAPIEQVVTAGPELGVPIVDQANHYNGLLGTMDCVAVTHSGLVGTIVEDVRVEVAVKHSYLGDLIFKLVSPEGTIVTLMNRPGAAEPADSYAESPNGDSSNLDAAFPILFSDSFPDDAELMGNSIDGNSSACLDDNRCEYFPSPGTGPGVALADFIGETPVGQWRFCAADGDSNDAGTIDMVRLTVRAAAAAIPPQ